MGLFTREKEAPTNGAGQPVTGAEASAITTASDALKSKRGGLRPGNPGGRPRADGKPNVNGVMGAAKPTNQKPGEVEVSEADIEFCRTVAKAGLEILDRVETNVITGLIAGIGDKYVTERTDAYLKQREIGSGDIEVVVNAVGAIAAKYAILSRYAPEAALVSWAAIHGMAFMSVTKDLKQLAVAVKAAKGKMAKDETLSPNSRS